MNTNTIRSDCAAPVHSNRGSGARMDLTNVPGTENVIISAERRAPSAERRAAERRAPSAERRAPSAERRAPSAERRAPSAEAMTAPRAREQASAPSIYAASDRRPAGPACRAARVRPLRPGARRRGAARAHRGALPPRRAAEAQTATTLVSNTGQSEAMRCSTRRAIFAKVHHRLERGRVHPDRRRRRLRQQHRFHGAGVRGRLPTP